MAEPVPILGKPGIQRDGTMLDADACVDGRWCRWDRGRPRKIGGYVTRTKQLAGTPRNMYALSKDQYTYLHFGAQATLERTTIFNSTGVTSGVVDRTPSGFVTDADNAWQFAELFDSVSGDTLLIAHSAPWASDISDETERDVYVGDHTGVAALTAIVGVGPTGAGVAGGCAVFHPYAFYFGANGYLQWSVPNQPDDVTSAGSGETNISSDKVVRGLPLRAGPGNAPSGLLWTLSSLVRVTFVGGTAIFNFDTISSQSSILSPLSVIEYDGGYFWIGVDRFLSFVGVLREVPNASNADYFFRGTPTDPGLNFDARGKVFSFKVPRHGEIWWCYPRGTATECTHAIILKPATGEWYDTPLPNGGRGAAYFAQVYRFPLMTGVEDDPVTSNKVLWQHETGTDEVDGSTSLAIQSFFETPPLAPAKSGRNAALTCQGVEVDVVQVGPITCTLLGRANARAGDVASDPVTIEAVATSQEAQVTRFKETRRQLRFRFESNVAGGDYWFGLPLAHVEETDEALTGALA